MASFVGANSAYVTKFYDQTGNGEHAEQATNAAQPRIVNAGSYDGKLIFDGSDDFLKITSLTNAGTACGLYLKMRRTFDAIGIIFETSSTVNTNPGALVFRDDTATTYRVATNNATTSADLRINDFTTSLNPIKQCSILLDRTLTGTSEIKMWTAGASLTPTAGTATEQTGSFVTYDAYIGSRAGTSFFQDFDLFTLVFYNTDSSSARASIETVIA